MSERLFNQRLCEADTVLVPKGENRQAAIDMLRGQGIDVPEFAGRCLHPDYDR